MSYAFPILKGTYTSNSGIKLPYDVYELSDDLFNIYFTNGKSPALAELFPVWKGQWFNVNNADFENFKNNVVNNPLASWIVTRLSNREQVEIPGTWTTDQSGGKKRSDKKRSDKKRSGHKRSDKRRKSHKRSGHKRSGHKRSGHKRP